MKQKENEIAREKEMKISLEKKLVIVKTTVDRKEFSV